MKKILTSISALLIASTLIAQQIKSNCTLLKKEGYTQNFCDYDEKLTYKDIPFGSNFEFVSSKTALIKTASNPTEFESNSDDYAYWAITKFDKIKFQFSSKMKLNGVQLTWYGTSDGKTDHSGEFNRMIEYLTNLFGKPQGSKYFKKWTGNNIYIAASYWSEDGAGNVAIFTINNDPLDGL
jgi:hypothetical protein